MIQTYRTGWWLETHTHIGLCLGFSNTSHVDSLDRFIKSAVEKVKLDINNLMKQKNSKEEKLRIKYSNEFI